METWIPIIAIPIKNWLQQWWYDLVEKTPQFLLLAGSKLCLKETRRVCARCLPSLTLRMEFCEAVDRLKGTLQLIFHNKAKCSSQKRSRNQPIQIPWYERLWQCMLCTPGIKKVNRSWVAVRFARLLLQYSAGVTESLVLGELEVEVRPYPILAFAVSNLDLSGNVPMMQILPKMRNLALYRQSIIPSTRCQSKPL